MASPSEAVLVTGSNGFTGAPLVKALKDRGFRVLGLTNSFEPDDVGIDLRDADAVRSAVAASRPDIVIHLAGISFAAHPSPAEVYDVNVVGAANLLAALRECSPKLTILASSAAVYASDQSGLPITEDNPLHPGSHYGVSKLTMELMMELAGRDLPIQIVRPFNYTGPGQGIEFFVPKIVEHFARGEREIRLGNLDVSRDIGSIKDVVESYARLVEKGTAGPPVNLCTGKAIPLRSIINRLSKISGHTLDVLSDSALIRTGEQKVIQGSRDRLDALIGAWDRQDTHSLLEDMYRVALRAQRAVA